MISKVRFIVHRLAAAAALAAAVGMAGCEGSSESHIWDGHDFGSNDANLYIAVGDSITSGYGLESVAEAYPSKLSGMLGKSVVNHGVQGSESWYGAENVYSVLGTYKPGYLLILYGVNDLILAHDRDSILTNLRTMVSAAKANQTIPVLATLTPVFEWYTVIEGEVAALNASIRLMGAEENVHIVDLERAFNWNSDYMDADGLHPNSQGHDLMASSFYDVLK